MTCAELCRLSGLEKLIEWIESISFNAWPQQHPIDTQSRPAMVTDLAWGGLGDEALGFGARTDDLVGFLLSYLQPGSVAYNRMLSVVMPGHQIQTHRDAQPPEWIARVHIPLVTNPDAFMVIGGECHHLEVGKAYLVDTREEHAIVNDGTTPRIHLMFDMRRTSAPHIGQN